MRGAPPELRRLIRKRQNSESAKRCRMRRKLELQRESNTQLSTAAQVAQLESLVASLASRLHDTQTAVATLLARAAPGTNGASQYATYAPTAHYPSPQSAHSRPTTPTDVKLPLLAAVSPVTVLPTGAPMANNGPHACDDLTATIVELEAALGADRTCT